MGINMSNIREYIRKKKENEENKKIQNDKVKLFKGTGTAEMNKKLALRTAGKAAKVLLGFGIIAAVIIYLYASDVRQVYTGYEVLVTQERADAVTAQYEAYNGGILKYSKDGASYIDINNKALWNQTYEMQNPLVSICESYVAIADRNGTNLYIMNTSGIQGEIDTLVPIQKVRIASQGVVAVLLEDNGTAKLRYYDQFGEELAERKFVMEQSGYPLDFALSKDALKLAVSQLSVGSNSMINSVAFYNLGEVGENDIEHIVSSYEHKETIFPKLEFMGNDVIAAFGDNKFAIYEGKQIPELVKEVGFENEIQKVFHDDKYIGFIFRNEDGTGQYKMCVFDLKGTEILTKAYDGDFTDIQISDGQIILNSEMECLIFNMKGIQKFKGSFHKSVIKIIPKDTNRYILIHENDTEIIKLIG